MKESYLYEIDFYSEPLADESIEYLKKTVLTALTKDSGYDEDLVKDIIENCDCGACSDSFISSLNELREIYNSPCGMAGGYAGMVYFADTNEFFDNHEDVISEMMLDFDESVGENYLSAKFGKDFLEKGEKFAKNTATWFAFEEVARNTMERIEIDTDKIKFASEMEESNTQKPKKKGKE